MDKGPLVSISCITYNHAPYIRQCLDGFLMQKTDFTFEILIHDDCSTDGTTEIIKEYELKFPDIIKPLYEEENQWVKGRRGSAVFNLPRAKGEYIAMCEGDDYWTDPLKLQKQVDFLEANSNVDLVWTRAKCYSQSNKTFLYEIGKNAEDFDDLLLENVIPTLTVLYRRSVLESYNYFMGDRGRLWKMGDYPLWLYIALHGDIHFLDEVTSVYRYIDESASHFKSYDLAKDFQESAHSIRTFYLPYSKNINEMQLQDNYNHILLCLAFQYREYGEVLSYYKKIDKHSLTFKDRLKYMISYVRLALRLHH